MKKDMLSKTLVLGVVVLFIGMSVIPSSGTISEKSKSRTIINNGSLSGYVNDTSMNPIEGALVRVYFHESYEEDYSDEEGYYHVTNIPICYCLKNTTCSKECYMTECVSLSIVENTIHDFILNTTNHPPSAPSITGPGSAPSGSIKVIVKNPANFPPGTPIEFRFEAIDPDGDNVSYLIAWDDGYEEWTDFYPSGEEITRSHTYNLYGTFEITARARDIHGLVGPEGTLPVTMSKSTQQSTNPLFLRFLERFPLLERFLFLLIK